MGRGGAAAGWGCWGGIGGRIGGAPAWACTGRLLRPTRNRMTDATSMTKPRTRSSDPPTIRSVFIEPLVLGVK